MTHRYTFFFFMLSLVFLMAVMHFLAVELSLYWSFPKLDNIMHFLGGFIAGGFGLGFFFLFKRKKIILLNDGTLQDVKGYRSVTHLSVLATAVLCAFLVGLFWEVYELGVLDINLDFYYGIFGEWSLADTMSDLFFDSFGGAIAAVYFLITKPYQNLLKRDA